MEQGRGSHICQLRADMGHRGLGSVEARTIAVSRLWRPAVIIIGGGKTVDGQLSGEQVGVDVVGPDGGVVIFEMAEEATGVLLPRVSIESAAEKSEADIAI